MVQCCAAPRGAVFETRLAASGALRELGNERYRANNFEGARVAYERSLWQAHFDEAWVKLELTDDHRGQLFDVTVPANLNCARCLLKTANTSEAKGHVDAALLQILDELTGLGTDGVDVEQRGRAGGEGGGQQNRQHRTRR